MDEDDDGGPSCIDALGIDEVATVLGFLTWREILLARVCRKLKDAAVVTPVPSSSRWLFCFKIPEYDINSLRRFKALTWMAKSLPNLHQLYIFNGLEELLFGSGENPESIQTSHPQGGGGKRLRRSQPNVRIDIITRFKNLRNLHLSHLDLNGRYPCLFNFTHLRKLHLQSLKLFKWDLEMVSAFPVLEDLDLSENPLLRGDVESLRVLKDTLFHISIEDCPGVGGNFMELADFPSLKVMVLWKTSVTGDVRNVSNQDFPELLHVRLPTGVYGGIQSVYESVTDAHECLQAEFRLSRHGMQYSTQLRELSRSSPDYYNVDTSTWLYMPFKIRIMKAGERLGWRWTSEMSNGSCETNWIDPERSTESEGYAQYLQELEEIEKDVMIFKGFYKPPTQAEYKQLCLEYARDKSSYTRRQRFEFDYWSDDGSF